MFTLVIGGWLSVCWIACQTPQTPSFQTGDFQPLPEQQLSYLNIPVVFDIPQLQEKINEALPSMIYRDESFDNNNQDNIKLRISKRADIEIDMNGNEASILAPLKVWAEGKVDKKVLGIKINKQKDIYFSVNLLFKSRLSISPDGDLLTATKLERITWVKEPTVKIAFVEISLKNIAERAILAQEAFMLEEMDKAAKEHVNVKKSLLEVWREIQKPILINRQFRNVWLLSKPVELSMTEIRSTSRYIYLTAGILAYLETAVANDKPEIDPLLLPDISRNKDHVSHFDLKISGIFPYDDINQVIKDSLLGLSVTIADHKVSVKQANVFGAGDAVAIELDLTGDLEAKVYLRGVPEFDTSTYALYVSSMDFDLQTQEMLLATADWLFHDEFRDLIRQEIHLPLQAKVEEIPMRIKEALAKGKLGEKVAIELGEFRLNPHAIVIRPDGIHSIIGVKGRAGVKVQQL